jgi:hypothetical protein
MTIRSARPDDADFIARPILSSMRGHRSRGWFLIGNEAAERCYAKAGFVFAEEKRDASFEALIGAPGFRRFSRAM